MNSILAALLTPAGASAQTPSTSSQTDPTSGAQFKSQFDQAVTALANSIAGVSTQGSNASANGAQAATAGNVNAAAVADALAETLQKKISDLLAKGESVSDIVQQLAGSLAQLVAQQLGGDPAQIQNQLQTAFAAALSPPNTGPPLSNTDLASALAQRFQQVAELAAGVLGETGQSDRLSTGSISDAATTAGVQPAPQETSQTAADSIAADAQAFLAALTASQGDGKTVASNGAPALGTNGDTLLGRILARAAQAQVQSQLPPPPAATDDPPAPPASAPLSVLALANALAQLGGGTQTPPTPQTNVATGTTAAAIAHVGSDAETAALTNSGSTVDTLATSAPAPLSPAVTAFLKTFSDALVSADAPASIKTTSEGTDPGALLQTNVSSTQAPTIGAFAPVQPAVQNGAASADGSQNAPYLPSQTTVDPNSVVEQLVRGAFMNTVGNVSTVRLHLVPQELGDVSVKLSVDGTSVSAQVTAQTTAAHDALVAGQAQLQRSLADAGLKLTSFNVDLAGGFASFQQQQQQQSSQQGQSNGRTPLGGVDTTETDDGTLPAASNLGPPVLAGVNWSALNYLA